MTKFNARTPLVVDLDGTLTPTDTLIESLLRCVRLSPASIPMLAAAFAAGRAALKEKAASLSDFSAGEIPYRQDVVEYLQEQRRQGRRLILATAAHRSVAESVARHLGLFDEVIATELGQNLKGQRKLQAIQEQVGARFAYAGDGRADLPIWKSADAAVLVGVSAATAAAVRKTTPVEREFERVPVGPRTWAKALRLYQWVKNLLVFVPLLTSFGFADAAKVRDALLAFLAFSLAASATYVVNDLWDIDYDRQHPRKRERAFAAALISIPQGMVAALGLLILALVVGGFVGVTFLASLVVYLVLTSGYSWVLKRYVLIDVLTLSMLYTLRILAGSLAIGVTTSSWLLALSVFLFFGLAMVKRCAELVALSQAGTGATRGRDYRQSDLSILWPLGVASGVSAVVVFGLYISTPETQARYGSPDLLWLVGAGLLYWQARLWIKTSRGEMNDDPIVFAARDFGSRVTVAFMVALTLLAYFARVGAS